MKKLLLTLFIISFSGIGHSAEAAVIEKGMLEKAFIDHSVMTAAGVTATAAIALAGCYFATRTVDEFDEPEDFLVWAKRHKLKIGIALATIIISYCAAGSMAKKMKAVREHRPEEQHKLRALQKQQVKEAEQAKEKLVDHIKYIEAILPKYAAHQVSTQMAAIKSLFEKGNNDEANRKIEEYNKGSNEESYLILYWRMWNELQQIFRDHPDLRNAQ
ncbi:MAG: hypothetical protein WCT20_00880 [Candidatus Babeliales bacterium]